MKRRRRAERTPAAPESEPAARLWLHPALLFAFALVLRLLFWQATLDAAWPYSAAFKGDTVVFLHYAEALQQGREYELGLPIHPPGTPYLLAALWNGRSSGFFALRLIWCCLGAALAPAVYLAARGFGERPARVAGLWTAAANPLLQLSASVDAETPYLLLAVATLIPLSRWRAAAPSLPSLIVWGALSGLACLFRAEHALAVVITLGWLARGFAPLGAWRVARLTLAVVLGAGLALLPWHVTAWRAIARFNNVEPVDRPTAPPDITWAPETSAWRQQLPAFARPTALGFVGATVRQRGRTLVTQEDTRILDQAFGSTPAPLGAFPFVSLYGPLNFALANRAGADGGFSAALLEQPPPLAAERGLYPAALVAHLPPAQLSFPYPPHLQLVNEGYAVGLRWIGSAPGEALRLLFLKLRWSWAGAAGGLGGYNLPLGLSGERRAVDLTVATPSVPAALWRGVLLLLAVAGAVACPSMLRPLLVPWLALGVSKFAAAAAFFGYARLGACCTPLVGLLIGLALERWCWSRRAPARTERWLLVAAATLVLVEGWRSASHHELRLDGQLVTPRADPFPFDLHRHQRLGVR